MACCVHDKRMMDFTVSAILVLLVQADASVAAVGRH